VQEGLRQEEAQVRAQALASENQERDGTMNSTAAVKGMADVLGRGRGTRILARVLAVLALACLVSAATAQVSGAETTHKFIKQLELPGGGGSPLGVDPQGNILVWRGNAIYKFNPNGEPVDFTGLGTSSIDGLGGGNCPATPADCDQIPFQFTEFVAADMNQATTGPTAGYIYVAVARPVEPEGRRSRTFVFDAAGVFKGRIDTSQPLPQQSPEGVPRSISISPNGSIVIAYNGGENNFDGNPMHADKYQAVDGNPANDAFVGQIRKPTGFSGGGLNEGSFGLGVVADDEVVYAGQGQGAQPVWELFDGASFASNDPTTFPVNLDPNQCVCSSAGPWQDGGLDEETGGFFESVSIDPSSHHAYLLDGYGLAEEWASPSEKVGPSFGSSQTLGGAGGPMAFDTSGIAGTNGRIYIARGGGLAVFSPPVPIADFSNLNATVGHDEADLTATVNLDHGPKVTDCQIQWGEANPEQAVFYGQSIPCNPPTPYNEETTPISGHLAALQTERDYRARIVVKTTNGVNRSQSLLIHPHAVLSLSTAPATNVGRTTAELNGSLNPDGLETTYWFEYGANTEYRQKTAALQAAPGSTTAPVPPTELQNLQPGRRYHFRLVATNELGETKGEDQTFVAATAPAISGIEPSNISETSATLHARIDSGGYPTHYHFEYGPTTSYGSVAPAGDTDIGSDDEPIPVSAGISGLQPGVTYHFRVVATNQWGTTTTDDSTLDFFPQNCPNAYARQITRSSYLPDCRAYELVSPGNAGAVQLYPGSMIRDYVLYANVATYFADDPAFQHFRNEAPNTGEASSPPRFGFLGALGVVSGTNPTNTLMDMYTATRTEGGWVTNYWGLPGDKADFVGGQNCSLSMDVCMDYDNVPIFGMPIPPGQYISNSPYVWDAEGHSLGRWPTNVGVVKDGLKYEGDDRPSPDFSHYVFSSRNIAFTTDGLTTSPGSVYDNDISDATVTVVSKLPNGEPIPPGQADEYMKIPAVSRDGSHILMSTPAPGGVNLYMRVDDAITYEVAVGMPFVRLIGMTNDGSEVAFVTRAHATADDADNPFSSDIFVWKESTGEVTRISQGNGEGDGNECNPPPPNFLCAASPIATLPVYREKEKVETDDLMASESGDVYFYSPEQLDPKNPGVFNENNLYVYRHGRAQYVATLDAGTTINRLQISPDGLHAAFVTAARLTSYDNEGWKEMYTFDPETETIRCVSCNPDGSPPSNIRPPLESGAEGPRGQASADVIASGNGRFMSDDGRTVFTTSEALVDGDTNGLADVYEFVAGRPQLISSGTAKTDKVPGSLAYPAEYTGLEGISRDGVDIYFSTYDTLAPQEDFNGEFVKFYDARTGGGFPPGAAKLPCVAADECHGSENAGPQKAVIGTGANLGQSDRQPATKKARKKKSRKSHHKRAKSAHKAHRRHRSHRRGK
jgi:hypothetical protein